MSEIAQIIKSSSSRHFAEFEVLCATCRAGWIKQTILLIRKNVFTRERSGNTRSLRCETRVIKVNCWNFLAINESAHWVDSVEFQYWTRSVTRSPCATAIDSRSYRTASLMPVVEYQATDHVVVCTYILICRSIYIVTDAQNWYWVRFSSP